jgi:hypothetical protein
MKKTYINNIEIKNGDYFLVHNYPFKHKFNPLAWLIQLFTRCYYHHCSIYFDGYIYEAVSSGFKQTHNINDFISDIGNLREIALCREDILVSYNSIKKNLDTKYDFVGLLFQLWKQLFNTWIGGERTKKVTCSTILAKLFKKDKWWEYDPQDLFRESVSGNKIIYISNLKGQEKINTILNSI